jgi:prepilin-type N-terminal cleavage/methylation domain-containing protein
MLKRVLNQKGITLSELIVTMLVMSIIMLAVTTVFLPMYNAYVNANEMAEINALFNTISALVMDDVENAGEIDDSTFTLKYGGAPSITYTVDAAEGFLRRNGSLILEPGYYRNKRVDIDIVSMPLSGTCTVTLSIYNREGDPSLDAITRSYVARPIGMQ